MLLKFFSLLFYWKTKKATLFEMGETKENMLLCVFCSLFCECYAKKKKTFPEVVNLDDAQKCGWKRLESGLANQWLTSRNTKEQDFVKENLKFSELLLQSHISFS